MNDTTSEIPPRTTPAWGLLQFAVKAFIVAACILFVANWIIGDLQESATETVANLRQEFARTPIGGRQFWGKIERALDLAADPASDLPAEKKQKLLNDIRVIVVRWKPFIDAVSGELAAPARHSTAN